MNKWININNVKYITTKGEYRYTKKLYVFLGNSGGEKGYKTVRFVRYEEYWITYSDDTSEKLTASQIINKREIYDLLGLRWDEDE